MCVRKKWWIKLKLSFKIDKFLTRRYSNHSAPILQSRPKSLVRKLATFCRPLLDMKPVVANSLMLASTKGTPVFPSEKSRQHIFRYYFINSKWPSDGGKPALLSKSYSRQLIREHLSFSSYLLTSLLCSHLYPSSPPLHSPALLTGSCTFTGYFRAVS